MSAIQEEVADYGATALYGLNKCTHFTITAVQDCAGSAVLCFLSELVSVSGEGD
jgi:hypothetical protein